MCSYHIFVSAAYFELLLCFFGVINNCALYHSSNMYQTNYLCFNFNLFWWLLVLDLIQKYSLKCHYDWKRVNFLKGLLVNTWYCLFCQVFEGFWKNQNKQRHKTGTSLTQQLSFLKMIPVQNSKSQLCTRLLKF